MSHNITYNTEQEHILLREYGRNVQNLVKYIAELEDEDKKARYSHMMAKLMRQVNPNIGKENEETEQKLWDDMYIISDFELNTEGPFPKPERDILNRKPRRMEYQTKGYENRHFGRNIENLIRQAASFEDPAEQERAVIYAGRMIKNFYHVWNKENLEDEMVIQTLRNMIGRKLDLDLDSLKDRNLFDLNVGHNHHRGGGHHHRNHGGGRNRKNHRRNKRN